jgi:hypothetical protein
MAATRLTRRATLALGLAGALVPKPFIRVRTAMADDLPDTIAYSPMQATRKSGFSR